MQTMTKIITIFIYLIFYYREIVKLDHFMTLFLSNTNTVPWCSSCKVHRFVAASFNSGLVIRYKFIFVAAYIVYGPVCCTLKTKKPSMFPLLQKILNHRKHFRVFLPVFRIRIHFLRIRIRIRIQRLRLETNTDPDTDSEYGSGSGSTGPIE